LAPLNNPEEAKMALTNGKKSDIAAHVTAIKAEDIKRTFESYTGKSGQLFKLLLKLTDAM
jgi:hypothetical protein